MLRIITKRGFPNSPKKTGNLSIQKFCLMNEQKSSDITVLQLFFDLIVLYKYAITIIIIQILFVNVIV